MAKVKIYNYKGCIDNHNYPQACFSMRASWKLIDGLNGLDRHFNFGNPFASDDNVAKLKKKWPRSRVIGHGNVKEVSELFVEWIKGNVYEELEPRRRKTIVREIELGNLDDTTFLYYRKPDLEDPIMCTSHIHELVKYINELREKKLIEGG